MEFNYSTFILEIINFVVLVWLLTRFLYRPVLRVMEQRRAALQQEMEAARAAKQQAETQLESLQKDHVAWEHQKQNQRELLAKELEEAHAQGVEKLKQDLSAEQERFNVSEANRKEEMQRAAEEQALRLGAQFTARLLQGLSGPELEDRLIRLFLDEMRNVSREKLAALRTTFLEDEEQTIRVASAFEISPALQADITQTLHHYAGRKAPVVFITDSEVIAGLRVNLGYWLLHANLKDELRFFVEGGHDPGSAE